MSAFKFNFFAEGATAGGNEGATAGGNEGAGGGNEGSRDIDGHGTQSNDDSDCAAAMAQPMGIVPCVMRPAPPLASLWPVQLGTRQVTAVNGSLCTASDPVARSSDVTRGVYEGGFKLWESTLDVVRVLDETALAKDNNHARVLDLGCGSGLLGVHVLLSMPRARVTFQDLNEAVLSETALVNIGLIAGRDGLDRARLVFGPWHAGALALFPAGQRFDLIVTSETLYDAANFIALHRLLEDTLAPGGRVLVGAKRFYFGVGGGAAAFMEFASRRGVFDTRLALTMADGASNLRDVFWMERRA